MDNFFGVLVILILIAAWFNHVFYCFASEMWGFLIAGALFFPVAIVHGVYLWCQ